MIFVIEWANMSPTKIVPGTKPYTRRHHCIYNWFYSSIGVFYNLAYFFDSWRSVICPFSSLWKTSCYFLPRNKDVVHFCEEFYCFNIISDSRACDFLSIYTLFLYLYKAHDASKSPITIVSPLFSEKPTTLLYGSTFNTNEEKKSL